MFSLLKGSVKIDNIEYEISNSNFVVLKKIGKSCDHFIVPSDILHKNGSKYKVIGISQYFKTLKDGQIDVISFDKSTEIQIIPTNFIFSCSSSFYMPPNAKKVIKAHSKKINSPKILFDGKNEFISVISDFFIMNNHPLELVCQEFLRTRLIIRETMRIVAIKSFYSNNNIKSVIFPSSVEIIGAMSFYQCKNLINITFKGNSKLRRIEGSAFSGTSLFKISLPASLEEVLYDAFGDCQNLTSINLHKDSKLKSITNNVFDLKNIESFDFPASIELIGRDVFAACKISSISFPIDSRLIKIEENVFQNTKISSVVFPPSLEVIGCFVFSNCLSIQSIRFRDGSKLKIIMKFAFYNSSLKIIELPSSLEEIQAHAFENCRNLASISFQNDSRPNIAESAFTRCSSIGHNVIKEKI